MASMVYVAKPKWAKAALCVRGPRHPASQPTHFKGLYILTTAEKFIEMKYIQVLGNFAILKSFLTSYCRKC
jgi:hypothetical protein